MTNMQFPKFLYGTWNEVERAATTTGAEWAHHYERAGSYPELVDREVEAGEVVLDSHDLDYNRETKLWRLGAISKMLSAALEDRQDRRVVREGIEGAFDSTPWGVLLANASQGGPHTVAALTARVQLLLKHWQPLRSLRYVGKPRPLRGIVSYPVRNREILTLDEHVAELLAGPLAVWGDPSRTEVRDRLEQALQAMTNASPDEVRTRLVARMVVLARENPRLRTQPELADSARIAAFLDGLDESRLAELRSGESPALISALHELAGTRRS